MTKLEKFKHWLTEHYYVRLVSIISTIIISLILAVVLDLENRQLIVISLMNGIYGGIIIAFVYRAISDIIAFIYKKRKFNSLNINNSDKKIEKPAWLSLRWWFEDYASKFLALLFVIAMILFNIFIISVLEEPVTAELFFSVSVVFLVIDAIIIAPTLAACFVLSMVTSLIFYLIKTKFSNIHKNSNVVDNLEDIADLWNNSIIKIIFPVGFAITSLVINLLGIINANTIPEYLLIFWGELAIAGIVLLVLYYTIDFLIFKIKSKKKKQ